MKDKNSSVFRNNINNTQVTTKLIALTCAINYFEKCFYHKVFRVYRWQGVEGRSVCLTEPNF